MNVNNALATTMAIGAILAGTPALAGTSASQSGASFAGRTSGSSPSWQSRGLVNALKHIGYQPGRGGQGHGYGHDYGHDHDYGHGDPYKSNGC